MSIDGLKITKENIEIIKKIPEKTIFKNKNDFLKYLPKNGRFLKKIEALIPSFHGDNFEINFDPFVPDNCYGYILFLKENNENNSLFFFYINQEDGVLTISDNDFIYRERKKEIEKKYLEEKKELLKAIIGKIKENNQEIFSELEQKLFKKNNIEVSWGKDKNFFVITLPGKSEIYHFDKKTNQITPNLFI